MNQPSSSRRGIAPADGLSHVCGRTDVPLSTLTIPVLLAQTAARWPDRPAVAFQEQGVRWSWSQFAAEADRLAAGLSALGLKRGDRVGIWSPNRVEWLVTQFATARIGVILVNINPAYRLAELEYALNASGCRAIVSAERLRTSNYLEMLQTLAPELQSCEPGKLASARLPMLQFVIRVGQERTPGMLNYDEVLAIGDRAFDRASFDAATAALDCHDPINIQFTSGTTGNPKGATLTHHNVVNNARFIAQAMRFSEGDSLCIPVPLYHCFGMVLAVLACLS
ncbi:MAG TPA: AMP-binding protein, partial [Burkholderiaceae bacterium]|nr:AMP-binding protein [Burkholderiaceae bacterium]